MTLRICKSALAENDLIGIWQYTFEHWDAAQADKYLDEVDASIQRLVKNPEMGEKRDNVREGCRVVLINSHAVYYVLTPSTIYIVRVLHGQMDPGTNL